MARNFQGLKFVVFTDQSRTSKILSSKILPLFFLITRTAHAWWVVLLVNTTFTHS